MPDAVEIESSASKIVSAPALVELLEPLEFWELQPWQSPRPGDVDVRSTKGLNMG